MNTAEQNLKIWNKANASPAPTNFDLQFARSLNCQPEMIDENKWRTPSTTKENVVYIQTIYFAGFSDAYSHGIDLKIECTCPAKTECIHALKLQRVYCANWSYLFILFGMKDSVRFGELWSRAQAVYALMERERKLAQVPVQKVAA